MTARLQAAFIVVRKPTGADYGMVAYDAAWIVWLITYSLIATHLPDALVVPLLLVAVLVVHRYVRICRRIALWRELIRARPA